jgi:hypothetical protein
VLELTGGTLAAVVPLHTSSLLFLLGGGRSPLYPPNKVILWDDAIGSEVAELEFRERVRGIACRRGWVAVALRRRVVVFEIGERVTRHGEWDTCDNPGGECSSYDKVFRFVSNALDMICLFICKVFLHLQLVLMPPCWPYPADKWATSN